MRRFGIVALAPLLVCAGTTTALAQTALEADTAGGPPRAPSKALELSVDGGYTQGFGSMYGTRSVGDVAGAGLGLGLGLGYRASPGFSIGLTGQLQGFNTISPVGAAVTEGSTVRGAAAGIAATFHTAPFERADPYLTLGAGYRALMEQPANDQPSTLTHGVQLGRVELGVDVRASESISFSPLVGADLDMFLWQKSDARSGRNEEIQNRGVSGFLFAGVRGRFNIGGTREARPREPTTTTVVVPGP